jgi:hypothetical protein
MSKIIRLNDVRLAFPDLFKPTAYLESTELKYRATFLMPKEGPQAKLLLDTIKEVAVEEWKTKADSVLSSIANVNNKYCVRDGDTKPWEGAAGCLVLIATNELRPTVWDRKGQPLTKEDGKPYSGCYVNANVQIWAQDNKFGKAIRASLRGVQFYRDGDAFGASTVADVEEFEIFDNDASVDDLV